MTMLIIDGVKYKLWTPKDEEKEFHPMVKEHSKEIFGENSIYFDVKHKLKSKSGIGSIPDAYVIKLSKPYEWYVVENELSSHPIFDHIVKQLTKFMNGVKNPESRNEILEAIDEEIRENKILKAQIEDMIDSPEIYRFMSKLLSNLPRIVVVIDELNEEVKEACQSLKYETQFVEFKTFVREDAPNVHAYLFEPLYAIEKISKKEEERKRLLPEHYQSWDKMLAWVDEKTRLLTRMIMARILGLEEVNHYAHGTYYCFYKGKPTTKSIFAALMLTKNYVKVRIRTDPNTFKDSKKWTGEKIYRGWFFKQGQERGFRITEKDQMDYAMELIKQSYNISGETKWSSQWKET